MVVFLIIGIVALLALVILTPIVALSVVVRACSEAHLNTVTDPQRDSSPELLPWPQLGRSMQPNRL
jgi:hypothetical protein